MSKTVYDFEVTDILGRSIPLKNFQNKLLIIVNTASQCGLTPQYKGLEDLYQKYHAQGLEILAFPCNQFGGQEPGSEKEIAQFCELNYKTTFPLFAKVEVNGKNTHPLFNYLKSANPGLLGIEAIKWNFTKFLINKNGHPIKRFAPTDKPESMEKWIKENL